MLPITIITVIFAYFIYAAHILDLHRPALDALSKPIAEWFSEPGNPVSLSLWACSLILCLASWLSPQGTLFNSMLPDFIVISLSIIGIDRLVEYRNYLQEKQRIIEDMGSYVNDTARDAVRLAKKHGWLEDGSLTKVELRSANLENVIINGADFIQAQLEGINLKEAKLISCNFDNADLTYANLENALLFRTNLDDAVMHFANLNQVVTDIDLIQGFSQLYPRQHVDWEHFEKARTSLRHVQLVRATLIDATLPMADLEGAQFHKADLTRVNLSHANLQDAVFYKTKLDNACFYRANLKGVDFYNEDLASVNLEGAFYNDDTIWPSGFDPVAAGAIKVDD